MHHLKVTLLCLFLLTAISSNAQDSLIIHGTIDKNLNERVLILDAIYSNHTTFSHPIINQQSIIENGKFYFKVNVKTLESYSISLKGNNNQQVSTAYFFFSPKITKINFLDTMLLKYEVYGNDIDKKAKELGSLTNKRIHAQNEINNSLISYIQENPSSPLNIGNILSLVGKIPEEKIVYLYSLLKNRDELSSRGKDLNYVINNLFVGKTIANFKQTDTNGIVISIKDFRGKYILIDFWASWCLPCRKENPQLIKAHQKYSKKNFEILSVSSDKERDLWLAAIKDDGAGIWKHVSDLKGIENYVTWNIFKITAIPANYLIDPQGKIIAKDLSGEELLAKLNELILNE